MHATHLIVFDLNNLIIFNGLTRRSAAGSNSAEGIDVRLLCLFFVVQVAAVLNTYVFQYDCCFMSVRYFVSTGQK